VKTVIIGGGISGLAAAYELAQANQPATLFDPAPLGGVIQTRRVADCLIEAGPDSFLSAKPAALQLIQELGLAHEVIGSNDHQRVTFIRRNGRMIPLPDGLMMMVPTKIWPMVTTPLLGWGTKIKIGLEFLRTPPSAPAEERSVAALVRDHYGSEAVDYLAEPLLAGVYGGDPERLSATSVLPRFVEMEKKYGSLTKGTLAGRRQASAAPGSGGTLFRTLQGGLQTWVDALERSLAGRITVRHEAIESVTKTTDGYRLQTAHGDLIAERLIVATPAWGTAKLMQQLDAPLATQLAAIEYSSSLTIGLVYDEAKLNVKLNGFGFLVPQRERDFLLACTWVHRKFNHRAPSGKAVVRAFSKEVGVSDATAIERTRADLKRLTGLDAEPLGTAIGRWPQSMAQYTVGHQSRIAAIEARARQHPGLYLIGNAFGGIGIPDCIQLARQTVRAALKT
jgi:protoporphyrinogen/coproporphyrinogen III oxidase